jgi:hypothetical protein
MRGLEASVEAVQLQMFHVWRVKEGALGQVHRDGRMQL